MKFEFHNFTQVIVDILTDEHGVDGHSILESSPLLLYTNFKTKAANRGAKSRASYANLYATYVLVEDYVARGFMSNGGYDDYEGAQYKQLFTRQRELKFGEKLQNHALNQRLNEEFKKCFPKLKHVPISRDGEIGRYWFNERLLLVESEKHTYNIAQSILRIIDSYIETRMLSFMEFIKKCNDLKKKPQHLAIEFIRDLLKPNVDARTFEIVSYCILKYKYADQVFYWGWSKNEIKKDKLVLYKTGRTNANDGGIDFVMKPTGRFFQATERIDVKKFFLDIDKVHRHPITFVVNTDESISSIKSAIARQAYKKYGTEDVVEKYMSSIEEIINNKCLLDDFESIVQSGSVKQLMDEIIVQSKLEFNV